MEPTDAPAVHLRDLVKYFLTLGASGFGGPAALVAQMERDLVEARHWIGKEEFREAVAVCQSLPGPLAIQVGIFLSYLRAGFWGAWAGGLPLVMAAAPLLAAEGPTGPILRRLLVFFLKAGSLTFGSGLVIVPFLEKGLVQQTGWLNERTFLVAVAIGMLSPGPVVITATFVGYLVAGLWGSIVSTLGIFFPSFVLVLVAASALRRYRKNRYVQGFVKRSEE